jgi:cell wall-associated NlpC family hydrolase
VPFYRPALLLSFAALALVLAGCASSPEHRPEPPDAQGSGVAPVAPELPSRLSAEQANDVTLHAISLVGTPYKWGGNTPDSGFDCSGLIGYVYKSSAGVAAPRTVAALTNWGQSVPAPALRTGDLVVFVQKGLANHAGIYVGEGRFVHAPSTGGEVRLDALGSKYWSKQQVSYRRP